MNNFGKKHMKSDEKTAKLKTNKLIKKKKWIGEILRIK